MYAQLSGFQVDDATPIGEVHRSLRSVGGDAAPHLLGYTAVARVNPYQALLYQSFGDFGVTAAPILRGHDFRVIGAMGSLASSHTIHFHWLSWVLDGAEHAVEARKKADGFLGRLDTFRAGGGQLVWTVHNVYPHDAKYVDIELALRQGIAERADAVHVMAHATTTALQDLLTLDHAKLVKAPHPSYVGAYPDVCSRSEARAMLGIDADETVFVIFGALKQYKALHETLQAFRLLAAQQTDRRFRLIVAGHPDPEEEISRFVEDCMLDPWVLIEPRRISSDKTQVYLRAADVGLVTYSRSLNSGAALLYLSFGLPVVATDTPVLREALPPTATVFAPNPAEVGPEPIVEALRSAASLAITRDEVLESVAPVHGRRVSSAFCRDLAPFLGW